MIKIKPNNILGNMKTLELNEIDRTSRFIVYQSQHGINYCLDDFDMKNLKRYMEV